MRVLGEENDRTDGWRLFGGRQRRPADSGEADRDGVGLVRRLMGQIDIAISARKLIELYGPDAELIACGKAETHAECGEMFESWHWRRVAAAIAALQCETRTRSVRGASPARP